MLPEEIKDLIETLRADMSNQVREVSVALHQRFDAIHDKHNTTLSALAHLIQRVHDMTTVTDLKNDVASLEGDIDQLLAKFTQAQADAQAADDAAAGDIHNSLASIMAKVASALGVSDAAPASTNDTGSAASSTSAPVTNVGTDSTTAQTANGSTTTVQHVDGSASTVDASGTPIATDDTAAQAAKDAAAAAGVTVGG